jgi:hypothetical protein
MHCWEFTDCKRNLKMPINSRTLHLKESYNSQPTPHTAMQPRQDLVSFIGALYELVVALVDYILKSSRSAEEKFEKEYCKVT